jgi:hypothetical protein
MSFATPREPLKMSSPLDRAAKQPPPTAAWETKQKVAQDAILIPTSDDRGTRGGIATLRTAEAASLASQSSPLTN